MRDTTQENIVFKKWLETDVFSIADVFTSGIFDKSKVLYQGASYKDFF